MKQKQQVIVLVVLVVVGGLVWSFAWRRQAPDLQTANFIQDYKPLGEKNPRIHFPELSRAQATEYKSNGRNPFITTAPASPEDPKKPKPPIGPSAPSIPDQPTKSTTAQVPSNLKYFGYGTVPNGTPRLGFVTDGDAVYIVSEGGILLGRYRILKVGNSNLEIQEISSGLPGAMPLDEQAAPPAA
jgi:Tfp pilus assembly protein PilP